MNYSKTIQLICFACILLLSSCNFKKSESKSSSQKQPNILLILCDDLGYSDVGFNGSKDITTPALDKLANDGTVFTSAYVTHPFCGPSRASLMTGRYPHPMGAQFNLPPNCETIGKGIDVNETFISKILQDKGYYTGALGKWHLGSVTQYHPNNRGFDDFYGFLGGGHEYFPEIYREKFEKRKKAGDKVIFEYLHPLEHNGKEVRETEYITDALSREAERFVTDASEKEKPFFLYLAYNAPHVPLQAKKEDLAKFAHIKDEQRRTYAAMVYAVDRGVNKIVKKLKENNQFDNTLIVFLSDNGGKLTKGATNYPLREGKGSACEGGYRVPMFFHWPKNVPSGKRFNQPVSSVDFYPTFAKLAGATIPANKILDGKDMWNNFKNGKGSHKGEYIYCLRHRTGYTDVGVRRDQWKALRLSEESWKLYNIEKDKGETTDLSEQHPEILKELVSAAEKWSQTHAQPLWWHDKQTGVEWKEYKMPRFNETFALD